MKTRGAILHECLQRQGLVGAMLHDADGYEQAAAEYDKVRASFPDDVEAFVEATVQYEPSNRKRVVSVMKLEPVYAWELEAVALEAIADELARRSHEKTYEVTDCNPGANHTHRMVALRRVCNDLRRLCDLVPFEFGHEAIVNAVENENDADG